jgi:UDP-3-O-[3-hydroxymyristoyl] glucosamine N-acyltransferase
MKRTLKDIAQAVNARLIGNGNAQISSLASIASAKSGDLIFVEQAKSLDAAFRSAATAIVAGEFASATRSPKPLLIAPDPRLAFARAAELLCPPARVAPGIHPSAVVSQSARIGRDAGIECHALIADGVVIGERSRIGANSVIGTEVRIGADCSIAPNVTIYPGVQLGNCVTVHSGAVLGSDGFGYVRDHASGSYIKFPQIGGLEIGDDVEIGANTTIDRGALDVTVIGRGTKLDNLVHVGHNVRIGEDVVIAAQTGISGSAVVEDEAVIAGQVGIADHVQIGKGTILGAQCGVPSNKVIRGQGVVFWGTPARPIRQYLKELAVLARLAKKS